MTQHNFLSELQTTWPAIPWVEDMGSYIAVADCLHDDDARDMDVHMSIRVTIRIMSGAWRAHLQYGGFWLESSDYSSPVTAFANLWLDIQKTRKYLNEITDGLNVRE